MANPKLLKIRVLWKITDQEAMELFNYSQSKEKSVAVLACCFVSSFAVTVLNLTGTTLSQVILSWLMKICDLTKYKRAI